MIAEFMHYYHYTLNQVLDMYAVSFFALLSAMYMLKGSSRFDRAVSSALAYSGGEEFSKYLKDAQKQAEGAEGILKEVRMIRKLKNGR